MDVFHVDLIEFFEGSRPWGQLGRLVGQLDRWSRTQRAMVNDPDLARQIAESIDSLEFFEEGDNTPEYSQWDKFDELIATVNDLGERINAMTVAVNSTKSRAPRPHLQPRPVSARTQAVQARKAELEDRYADDLLTRLI